MKRTEAEIIIVQFDPNAFSKRTRVTLFVGTAGKL